MRFRDGLIAARGQVLWMLLLALASLAILKAESLPLTRSITATRDEG